jgi:kynureninase
MQDVLSRSVATALDAQDPLAACREAFSLPDGVIYFDGNSLGALPLAVVERLERTVGQEWGRDLIRSWNEHDWIGLPFSAGDRIAPLVGAAPGQVVVTDSTSINLFKALAAALRLAPDRHVILSDEGNFPTDLYMAEGLTRFLGGETRLTLVPEDGVARALGGDVAVVVLSHVDYRSGRIRDMAAVTEAVQAAGARVVWDLSHSVGVLPIALDRDRVDFAVGCTYKFLNAGPGAPAFLYVARHLHDEIENPLSGWMGHAAPFAFETGYRPAAGLARMLSGTSPILSMAALDAALGLMATVDIAAVREKAMALGDLFIALVEKRLGEAGLTLFSPHEAAHRGAQVSFRHADGYPIMQALIERGVIGDFRAPDILRFGVAPLYLRFVDVWDAVEVLVEIMASGSWDQPRFRRRRTVT